MSWRVGIKSEELEHETEDKSDEVIVAKFATVQIEGGQEVALL